MLALHTLRRTTNASVVFAEQTFLVWAGVTLHYPMKAPFQAIGSPTAVVCAIPVIQPRHLTDRKVRLRDDPIVNLRSNENKIEA